MRMLLSVLASILWMGAGFVFLVILGFFVWDEEFCDVMSRIFGSG